VCITIRSSDSKKSLSTFVVKEAPVICPNCGAQNPDDAPICSECRYRFRFGHAFNDPSQMVMPDFTGSQKRGPFPRAVRFLVLFLLIVIIALVIWLSLRSAGGDKNLSGGSPAFRNPEGMKRSCCVAGSVEYSGTGLSGYRDTPVSEENS
jgi:hypothetical protein